MLVKTAKIREGICVNIDDKFDIVIQRSSDDIGYIIDFFPAREGDLLATIPIWDEDLQKTEEN